MARYLFDLETNGLLEKVSKVHIVNIYDLDTDQLHRFNTDLGNVEEGIDMLLAADELVGHNILGYDLPVIKKLYGREFTGKVRDTLVLSRIAWPDRKERDLRFQKDLPPRLKGSHSLGAWGYRLDSHKGDYKGGWEAWSQEMQDYCDQDVALNVLLLQAIERRNVPEDAVDLEVRVGKILDRQRKHGFLFDVNKAQRLQSEVTGRLEELRLQLESMFGEIYTRNGKIRYPKRTQVREGIEYTEGAPWCPVKLKVFNPASRDHIAYVLKNRYGWVPETTTETGKPQVDEEALKKIAHFNGVPEIMEYLVCSKFIGTLSNGDNAWLKLVGKDGRIHGRVDGIGCVTFRMAHSKPNLGNVVAVKKNGKGPVLGSKGGWGYEARSLFTVPKGFKLVGCDADALELRCLGGYMVQWDHGDYVKTILKGDKSNGTDIHTRNQRAMRVSSRDTAKTLFYAFIYGSGAPNLGAVKLHAEGVFSAGRQRLVREGNAIRNGLFRGVPALKTLIDTIQRASESGYVRTIDRRSVPIRAKNAALNSVMQSAGAIFMKRGLVIADDNLKEAGYIPGTDYEFVGNIHDEWQVECRESISEKVGEILVDAIRAAGKYYDFGCPLDAQYKVGDTWADTH